VKVVPTVTVIGVIVRADVLMVAEEHGLTKVRVKSRFWVRLLSLLVILILKYIGPSSVVSVVEIDTIFVESFHVT